MFYREAPFGYFMVLDRGDEVLESITRFATETGIRAAGFSGLGTVAGLMMGYYDLATRSYSRQTWHEELQIASLTANLAEVDGGPFPHVHGVFARPDFSTIGGHVFEATVSVAVEMTVWTAPDPIRRVAVDFCDLKLLQL